MIVYRILNKLDGRSYIGQTKRTLAQRVSGHLHGHTAIGEDMARLGRENFDIMVLDVVETQEEADRSERYWIAHYDSIVNGYNVLIGGKPTKAEMKKLSKIPKKRKKKRVKPEKPKKLEKRIDAKAAKAWREEQMRIAREKEKLAKRALIDKVPLSKEQIFTGVVLMASRGDGFC